jgi:hypothetical protein
MLTGAAVAVIPNPGDCFTESPVLLPKGRRDARIDAAGGSRVLSHLGEKGRVRVSSPDDSRGLAIKLYLQRDGICSVRAVWSRRGRPDLE